MNKGGGFVPVEKRAYIQTVIDRRNKYMGQAESLQARADKLYAKVDALDEEIAAACE
jgi:hypothetical protein